MRRLLPTAAAGLVLLAACQDAPAPTSAGKGDKPALSTRPEGYPTRGEVRTGYVRGFDGQTMKVAYEVHEGRAIFEGDIDLGPADQIPSTPQQASRDGRYTPRLGVARDGSSARWPNGVVPYVIAPGFPSPSRVTNAIAHIQANTGKPTFVARTNQTDYVYIRTSTGCSSNVGRIGGVQYVNLASGCSTGNTIHELLHTLGMYHEQTRCDRDTYVIINTGNILSGYAGNFSVQCNGATDYGPYAEGSIMHYGPYDFSKNGLPTIVSRRGLDSQMGQRSGMNSTDISTINTLYP
jgi:hypothetical protein